MKLITAAEKLAKLREEENQIKEAFEKTLKPLQEEKNKVQKELIEELKKEGLKSVKTASGENYALKKSKSLAITSKIYALKWAVENHAVSINKTEVKKKLKCLEKLPNCFAYEEREFISISGKKNEETK